MVDSHYSRMQRFQHIAFKYFPKELKALALATIASIDTRDALTTHLSPLSTIRMVELCERLQLLSPPQGVDIPVHTSLAAAISAAEAKAKSGGGSGAGGAAAADGKSLWAARNEQPTASETAAAAASEAAAASAVVYPAVYKNREFLTELLVTSFERRMSQRTAVKHLSLYPGEEILWDENLVPSQSYSGEGTLALPKLNLQFLTFHDYLLRNFNLFRLESTYEIREDLAMTIERLRPRASGSGKQTVFTGWARMAVPIHGFKMREIKKPAIGDNKPARVTCEVTVDLTPFQGNVRNEWERVREHDIFFLVTVQATTAVGASDRAWAQNARNAPEFGRGEMDVTGATAGMGGEWEQKNRDRLGIRYVRGAEVHQILDEEKQVIGKRDTEGRVRRAVGSARTYRLLLDPAQYQKDQSHMLETKSEDLYQTFNLLIRRKPEENNFKAVLSTIRDLMLSEDTTVPDWLHDSFLGYGAPSAASYFKLPDRQIKTLNFFDTFVDEQHVKESFVETTLIKPTQRRPATSTLTATTASAALDVPPEYADPLSYRVTFPVGVAPDYSKLQQKVLSNIATASVAAAAATGSAAAASAAADVKTDTKSNTATATTSIAKTATKASAKSDGAAAAAADVSDVSKLSVEIEPYEPALRGAHVFRRNTVRFTPVQVEAIKSGLNPGLTMIVGPPGTGKTDTAVQIISELYHNFPSQRTLLVTHSNHALNDLFEKLLERDIDERYMLRTGHGEDGLSTDKDFSKFGRVNFMLSRRLALLGDVSKLAQSFGMSEDQASAYTCETAGHFFLYHVLSRWEAFVLKVKTFQKEQKIPDVPTASVAAAAAATATTNGSGSGSGGGAANNNNNLPPGLKKSGADTFIALNFPFRNYFDTFGAGGGVPFTGDFHSDFAKCQKSFLFLEEKFKELDECRPFEVLRSGTDRGNYLLTKHARIIAMTCTHAAIRRSELSKLKFQYDNLMMEEAGQILEIETVIPMLLQDDDREFGSRLKRVILLGDHHQLPPVVQNQAFQKFSHFDQSLFTRFIRLGMPYIQLNAQGRCRPSLAALWNWRYAKDGSASSGAGGGGAGEGLGNLPSVITGQSFQKANAGFAYEYQLINVDDFDGVGESTPTPFFYQNLGEAEYVVAVYMYMRLLGYPADKVSILTTYNGQKALIADIINHVRLVYCCFVVLLLIG